MPSSPGSSEAPPGGVNISKEDQSTISRAASVFVLYATSCANNFTRETQDNASDVFSAMEEMEFQGFITRLKKALEAYMPGQKGKKEALEQKKDKDKTDSEEQDRSRDEENNEDEEAGRTEEEKVDSRVGRLWHHGSSHSETWYMLMRSFSLLGRGVSSTSTWEDPKNRLVITKTSISPSQSI
ncbi:DNA polymerase epsilon subunit 3 [Fukomys damarensis]|uniref:DNA polymerase epsilon subunit 3 n=1 Tax=Fukomys damarensis TaxID=885580 RepID=A0A091CXJ3_FUKDA|nr:DNA polymerase epsilon subunit 3 [Fukomys damarensis]